MSLLKQNVCPDMPGVPPNPLPFWTHFPLLNKLPVPSTAPVGTVILYNGILGRTLWKTDRILDFELNDPNNYNYPATQEYNSLFDTHLRGYMASSHVVKILLRQRLITRDGHVFCRLRDFNRYRMYLHHFNIRIIKQRHENDEPRLIKRMMNATLNSVRAAQSNDPDIRLQYSGLLNQEAPPMEDQNDQDLHDEMAGQGFCEGEVKWCKWLNRILQEDCRKAALMRLRRIQKYADSQRKRWIDWRKRNLFDMEWLALEQLRKDQLENERVIHVEEHKRYTARQQAHVLELIRNYAEERFQRQRHINRTVAHHVCRKTCRTWPLSARCPRNVLLGVDPCGVTEEGLPRICEDKYESKGDLYDYVQQMVFGSGDVLGAPMKRKEKKQDRSEDAGTLGETRSFSSNPSSSNVVSDNFTPGLTNSSFTDQSAAAKTSDLQTVLSQLIIKNAIDLLARTTVGYGPELERVGPVVEPQNIIDHMLVVIKEEMFNLSKESPDVLLMIKDRLTEQVQLSDDKRDKAAQWDAAPELKSTQSLTGMYIAETMADVIQQMQTEGLVTGTMREIPIESRISRPATEVTLRSNAEDILRLPGGQEMIELATHVVRTGHRTLPGGTGDEQWRMLSACLVSNLMRTVLLELRAAMRNGQLGDADLPDLAHAVEIDDLEPDALSREEPLKPTGSAHGGGKMPHEVVRQKVAEQGTLLRTSSLTGMISSTVEKVKATEPSSENVEQAVMSHVEVAAQEFIDKIVSDIFADIDPARR